MIQIELSKEICWIFFANEVLVSQELSSYMTLKYLKFSKKSYFYFKAMKIAICFGNLVVLNGFKCLVYLLKPPSCRKAEIYNKSLWCCSFSNWDLLENMPDVVRVAIKWWELADIGRNIPHCQPLNMQRYCALYKYRMPVVITFWYFAAFTLLVLLELVKTVTKLPVPYFKLWITFSSFFLGYFQRQDIGNWAND